MFVQFFYCAWLEIGTLKWTFLNNRVVAMLLLLFYCVRLSTLSAHELNLPQHLSLESVLNRNVALVAHWTGRIVPLLYTILAEDLSTGLTADNRLSDVQADRALEFRSEFLILFRLSVN